MPRKKEAPQRRDEDERREATWRMGQPAEDSAENLEVNRTLTESAAASSNVTSLAEVASTAASSVIASAVSQQEREYNVIFDDDDEEEAEVISFMPV